MGRSEFGAGSFLQYLETAKPDHPPAKNWTGQYKLLQTAILSRSDHGGSDPGLILAVLV